MTPKKKTRSKFTPGDYLLHAKRSSAGIGLFAGEDIPKGVCVIEYVGRQVSKEEETTSKSKYLFEISKNKTIDGKPKWNKAGYINHTCKGNCEPEIRNGRIFIMSTRAIKKERNSATTMEKTITSNMFTRANAVHQNICT